ncbi:hypothetical protein COLO4_33513 [Corchorus olitorius]|uniref:Prolamin-like domain-containing protein n=1 Tax=Corchorus olitorius TaxID=93759 RepID=A0A1R3GT09_9ROSI|nr:hypothetical protein COLO4_33513 [Corchorus olitorius]
MASLKIISILLHLVLTSGVVSAAENPDLIIKQNNCKTKMSLACSREVFKSIFYTGAVTKKCCDELMVFGKVCHDAFVKKTLEDPLYKDLSKSTIAKKSIQKWNTCASVVDIAPSSSVSGVISPAKSPDLIIKENNCKTKMELPCAREVFTSIFKTGAVTKKCCGELKLLGKFCHDAFVKTTLEDPIYKNLSESAIAK